VSNCKCETCPVQTSDRRPHRSGRWSRVPLAMWVFLLVAAGVLVIDLLDARAEVFHSRESALELAFPEADSVTTRELTLSRAEEAEIRSLAGAELPTRLVRVYEAWSGGEIVARGIIDTHTVRSLPETLFVVADPSHRITAVHLLAFHEPAQYRAPGRWFSQFEGRKLDDDLALRRKIEGVAGATMTSNAVTAAVRRCVATLEVAFSEDPKQPAAVLGK
jgi:hypothetical protein